MALKVKETEVEFNINQLNTKETEVEFEAVDLIVKESDVEFSPEVLAIVGSIEMEFSIPSGFGQVIRKK